VTVDGELSEYLDPGPPRPTARLQRQPDRPALAELEPPPTLGAGLFRPWHHSSHGCSLSSGKISEARPSHEVVGCQSRGQASISFDSLLPHVRYPTAFLPNLIFTAHLRLWIQLDSLPYGASRSTPLGQHSDIPVDTERGWELSHSYTPCPMT
jgi:hypothetical protein